MLEKRGCLGGRRKEACGLPGQAWCLHLRGRPSHCIPRGHVFSRGVESRIRQGSGMYMLHRGSCHASLSLLHSGGPPVPSLLPTWLQGTGPPKRASSSRGKSLPGGSCAQVPGELPCIRLWKLRGAQRGAENWEKLKSLRVSARTEFLSFSPPAFDFGTA